MKSKHTFKEKSYRQHSEHFKDYTKIGKKAKHAKSWFDQDTVDWWRHQRMYRTLDPILKSEPGSYWLTVGDGRFGKDAKYIIDMGSDALATDISEYLLKEAKSIGYIKNYQVENAEELSFQNSAFDYVLCKESYHHFPRPMLSLYEMLRVANKAVILIEPNDPYIIESPLILLFRPIKTLVKHFLGIVDNKHHYEESGNYAFTISRREIEKVALGLNYKTVAFKGINDAYIEGVEFEKISSQGPLQKKINRLINMNNLICKAQLNDYGLLTSIIFKQQPSQKILHVLSNSGYSIIQLPENPYISS